ncbi:uracil-DNA glycosylase [Planctomycetota bacterium]
MSQSEDVHHELMALSRALRARLFVEAGTGVEDALIPGGLPAPPTPHVRSVCNGQVSGAGRAAAPPRRAWTPGPDARPPGAPERSLEVQEGTQPVHAAPAPAEVQKAPHDLSALERELQGCTRCDLSRGRQTVVFGVGDPGARLMFVGEGPGADEDRQGIPFVGRAGQLLDRIIQAMGLQRESVYIANVVKCRPPRNRNPLPNEVAACSPFLRKQIAIIQPEVLVALGAVATRLLLGRDGGMASFRGRWHSFEGIPLLATYHPAYLLRSPHEKRKVWDDMKIVMQRLGLPLA